MDTQVQREDDELKTQILTRFITQGPSCPNMLVVELCETHERVYSLLGKLESMNLIERRPPRSGQIPPPGEESFGIPIKV